MSGETMEVVTGGRGQPLINFGFVRRPKDGILMATEIGAAFILTLSGCLARKEDLGLAIPVVTGLFACIIFISRLAWYGLNLQMRWITDFAAKTARMELIYLAVCLLVTLIVTILAAVTARGSSALTVYGFFGVVLLGLLCWDVYFSYQDYQTNDTPNITTSAYIDEQPQVIEL